MITYEWRRGELFRSLACKQLLGDVTFELSDDMAGSSLMLSELLVPGLLTNANIVSSVTNLAHYVENV